MSAQTVGLVLGGLLPAIFFGLSGVFAKASTNAGIGMGVYLPILSIGIFLAGCGFFLWTRDASVSLVSGSHAFANGFVWALGAGFIAVALSRFDAPLAKLVPLYNMNTLVTVLLSLWIFSEWQRVHVPQLLIGSILVVVGGTLVARA